jgi:hypothetical protein
MENNISVKLFGDVKRIALIATSTLDTIPDTPPPVETPPTPPPPPDEVAPISTVEVLPNSVTNDFTVTWYGLDNEGGSGVATYDVFVATDGGNFELWQDKTAAISALYSGESDREYKFYSVASDQDGNIEPAPPIENQVQSVTTTNGSSQQSTIYRFFNPTTGTHFYTANVEERDNVFSTLDNYKYEGASYFAGNPDTGKPVYRFLNTATGVHIYTIDEKEKDSIIANLPNFNFEGEVFRAYDEQIEGTIPIYRFLNPATGTHFYTPTEAERVSIEETLPQYVSEGVAFYSFPLGADFTSIQQPENPVVPVTPTTSGVDFAGSTVILQQYGPNLDTPVTDILTGTVGDGVEFNDLPASALDENIVPLDVSVDVSGTSVVFTVEQEGTGTFEAGEFNGYLLVRDPNTTLSIENVVVDDSATTLPFDSSQDLIFLEEGIAVNLEGINYSQGDTLKLDVNFGDGTTEGPAPEPTDGVGFNGAQLEYQSYKPDFDTPVGDPIDFTVGDGAELTQPVLDTLGIIVDVTNNSIIIEVDSTADGTFETGEFSGEAFFDLTGSAPPITNVTIDSSATTLGVDSSDVLFIEDALGINLADVPYTDGDIVKLDVEFGEPVTSTPPAGSGNFTGAEIQSQFFAPDFNTPISDLFLETVGDGEEFFYDDGAESLQNFVDISGNSITYRGEFAGDFTYGGAEFIGFVVEDVSDTLPAIESVTINSSSTLGVDTSDIKFDENSIEFNLESLSFTDVGTVTVDVVFADV